MQTIEKDPASYVSLETNEVCRQISCARLAQQTWAHTRLAERLVIIRKLRHLIADNGQTLADTVTYIHRNDAAETLAAEVIPLADACKFLEGDAKRLLVPRHLGRRLRPKWLRGVSVELRRDPFGVVLIIGAANYPLFLPAVQTLQALTAGNSVVIKPGIESTAPITRFHQLIVEAGIDPNLMQILSESTTAAQTAMEQGVDKVVLTGSAKTGRHVQAALVESLTPATMELSGCDAVFVLPSADLERVARCLEFGLRFNNSATCIAPRRVFVPASLQTDLAQRLLKRYTDYYGRPTDSRSESACPESSDRTLTKVRQLIQQACDSGAELLIGDLPSVGVQDFQSAGTAWTVLTNAKPEMALLQSDVFAPVISLVPISGPNFEQEFLAADAHCPYALAATVFGAAEEAQRVARKIDAGCVVINDMIAPTADPRVPFAARNQSGFGATRGASGLLEMTQPKAIMLQRSRWLPHLDSPTPHDAPLLAGFLRLTHGASWRDRWTGLKLLSQSALAQRKWKPDPPKQEGTTDATE